MSTHCKLHWLSVAVLLAAAGCVLPAQAASNIVRDGSLGAGPTVALTPSGTVSWGSVSYQQIAIPETYGQRAGGNVFHSFSKFSVGSGDGAVFTINGPASNVISRVTGGQLSTIHGLLKLDPGSTGSAPHFFFINPAGVTFGAGAVVDVPAALHVSTANYLKFPDGNFHADTTTRSTFSSAAPEAFGFLGTTRAAVTVNGGALVFPKSPHPISVVAGDVKVDQSGWIATLGGGDIRVVAMGKQAQEVPLSGDLPVAYGDLDILNGGRITTLTESLANAGKVNVSSGNLTIDGEGSGLVSNSVRTEETGSSGIMTGSSGIINAAISGNIKIDNGGLIDASTYSSGDAGSVWVSAGGSITIGNGGWIRSETSSSGNAGRVWVKAAGSLSIDGKNSLTGISGDANLGATGSAGDVEVTVGGDLSLANRGQITSSTWSPGNPMTGSSGDAGLVSVDAGSIKIDGSSGIFSRANGTEDNGYKTGSAGDVLLKTAGNIELSNGGQISSSTSSSGDAGLVSVDAGSIKIDGSSGIFSQANGTEDNGYKTGSAGGVLLKTAGNIELSNGGQISSSTSSSGDVGFVLVGAGSHFIAGENSILIVPDSVNGMDSGNIKISGTDSGIFSRRAGTARGTTGRGFIVVAASGNIDIDNGGSINSTTLSEGNAGIVVVVAGSGATLGATLDNQLVLTAQNAVIGADIGNIKIDGKDPATSTISTTGIRSDAGNKGIATTGDAGEVRVMAAGKLEINHGGLISSDTYSSGDAGSVKVTAGSVTIDGRDSGNTFTGISSEASSTDANQGATGNAGNVEVTASGNLSVLNDGRISSSTSSSGNAGGVLLKTAGNIEISNGGQISLSTFSSGKAGLVSVDAGSIKIDGKDPATSTISTTGIRSDAGNKGIATTGDAGEVRVMAAGKLEINHGGLISSDTYSSGDAGSVKVTAGSVTIDGRDSGNTFTGISSEASSTDANQGATGNAGNVEVTASGNLSVLNDGRISSSTSSSGNAGGVLLKTAGNIEISNGGQISLSTFSSGKAGLVSVDAGSIKIDGKDPATSTISTTGIRSDAGNKGIATTGDAGEVRVMAAGKLEINHGGLISSDTYSSGDAGSVKVTAGSVTIDGRDSGNTFTGISSEASSTDANQGATGNAGNVEVTASGNLSVLNNSQISSSTFSSGKAGRVEINAANLTIDGQGSADTGIFSSAESRSSGQTGSVVVSASDRITLANGGVLSIRNDATVVNPAALTSTTLTVNAPTIVLKDAEITASSTGNVAASKVQVDFSQRLSLDTAGITTSANQGNGGSIDITGGQGMLLLDNAQISTSVQGAAGNGGDIHVQAHTLIMNTGFIQANTDARNASGGHVQIDVQALVPSGDTLFIGGQTPYTFQPGVFSFNVIQAAAPTGVSGVVQISTPLLDISGALTGFNVQLLDSGGLGHNPCRITGGSSLVQSGRGGFAPSARNLLGLGPVSTATPIVGDMPLSAGDPRLAFSSWGCARS